MNDHVESKSMNLRLKRFGIMPILFDPKLKLSSQQWLDFCCGQQPFHPSTYGQ